MGLNPHTYVCIVWHIHSRSGRQASFLSDRRTGLSIPASSAPTSESRAGGGPTGLGPLGRRPSVPPSRASGPKQSAASDPVPPTPDDCFCRDDDRAVTGQPGFGATVRWLLGEDACSAGEPSPAATSSVPSSLRSSASVLMNRPRPGEVRHLPRLLS